MEILAHPAALNNNSACQVHFNFQPNSATKTADLLVVRGKSEVETKEKIKIVVPQDTQLIIIDHGVDLASSDPAPAKILLQIVLEENSTLTHYHLQKEIEIEHLQYELEIQQARNSHYFLADFSQPLTKMAQKITIDFIGDHASCELNTLFMPRRTQQVEHEVLVIHNARACQSRIKYRGILDEAANASFKGKILVPKTGINTDAKLENKNLVLSDWAQINTQPDLEIYTDEVKCAHGATVGQLNKEQVFYLMARGLDYATARKILTTAFAQELFDSIKLESLKKSLAAELFGDVAYV